MGSRHAIVLVAVVIMGLAAYLPSLGHPFHYDDFHSLVENPHIRAWANLPVFFTSPEAFSSDPRAAMYRPLVLVSYAVNYSLSGGAPWSYHALNLAVHLAVAWAVYRLGRRWTGGTAGALMAMAVFALHPVNSEAVNYVSSRSESLCALFLLLALLAYDRGLGAAGSGAGAASLIRGRWQALGLLAFAASLLAKSVGIALLPLLPLWRAWRLAVPEPAVAGQSAPVAATEVPAPSAALTGGGRGPDGPRLLAWLARTWRADGPYWIVGFAYLGFTRQLLNTALVEQAVRPLGAQLLTQAKALVYYVYLLLVPVSLSVDHQFIVARTPWQPSVLAALACLFSGGWLVWRGRGWLGAGWRLWLVWPVVILLPTVVVPLNVLVNEHRLYLPSVAAGLGLGWLWEHRQWAARPVPSLLAAAGLLLLAVLAGQRTAVWSSGERLWQDALTKGPLMPRPRIERADRLKDAGRPAAAMAEYQRALNSYPEALTALDRVVAWNNLGATCLAAGRFVDAVNAYQQALALDPEYGPARQSLEGLLALTATARNPAAERLRKEGLACLLAGDLESARTRLEQSLQEQNDPQTWMALALVHERRGDVAAAAATYRTLALAGRGEQYEKTAQERLRALAPRR
jgi:tetratricopeptide (TPR) repeat protein